jgi:catalase
MYVLEHYTGVVSGYRRAHGRGVGLRGRFTPAPELATRTVAEHFQGPPVETVVRLSNAAGNPHAPDHQRGQGSVLGLGVRFALPSGGSATWAAPSAPAFPAATPAEFNTITPALRRSPRTGRPSVWRLLGYVLRHRNAIPAIKGIAALKPTASFAHTTFFGLHAYHLVDGAGRRQAFRYRWVPDAGPHRLSAADDQDLPPQYLIAEIMERVARGPVSWTLHFQLAGPGDPTHDITRQWPADRTDIVAGRLVLDRMHEDQDAVEGAVFDPTNVPPGIELSDDPLLEFRSRAYSASYQRRSREARP